MSVIPSGFGASDGYQIPYSLRFDGSNDYLSRTPASAGNQKIWTMSVWLKRSKISAFMSFMSVVGASTATRLNVGISTSDTFSVSDGFTNYFTSSALLRDPVAWYHCLVVCDTTNATAGDRIKVYINGVRLTKASGTDPTLNQNLAFNIASTAHNIGRRGWVPDGYIAGYLSEMYFIDGQALTAGDFGYTDSVTGQWRPKKYTGTYGTNGFYLPFNDGSSTTTLGADRSGNSNNWTLTNMTRSAGVNDCWMTDTPTNNYATLNPLNLPTSVAVLTEANLRLNTTGTGIGASAKATFGGYGGVKFYCEFIVQSVGSAGSTIYHCGIGDGVTPPGFVTGTFSYYRRDGVIDGVSYASYTSGDVIGCAVDTGAGTIAWYKNNTLQTAKTGFYYDAYFPMFMVSSAGGSYGFLNAGQRSFAYTPPAGFKALCTANLPVPSILNPREHFDVALWTGNGGSVSVTGVSFRPELTYSKSRNYASGFSMFDVVRGDTKTLNTAATGAEATVSSFTTNDDGFTVNPSDNTYTYASWMWKAGGAAVTNNAGSISSQVSANTTAGFSIVTYTGTGANATVGHGLGVAPKMVIVKDREGANDWAVYHAGVASDAQTDYLLLNSTAAAADLNTYWNDTAPTSSVFSIGTNVDVNSANDFIAYCFAEVTGFSKFGKYTGNGSADNAFVWCGFRPAFVLIKCSSTTGNWVILDNKRAGYNVNNDPLFPNLPNAEGTTDLIDITSNGFKVRSTNADVGAAQTYVFAAFAESPFNFANAR